VTRLADRGFGDPVRYELLDTLGWSHVTRFRGAIRVEHQNGPTSASEWLAPNGRARQLDGARVRLPTMRDEWFEGLMSALAAVLDKYQEMTEVLDTVGGDDSECSPQKLRVFPAKTLADPLEETGCGPEARAPRFPRKTLADPTETTMS
jgi:hypothetical protein